MKPKKMGNLNIVLQLTGGHLVIWTSRPAKRSWYSDVLEQILLLLFHFYLAAVNLNISEWVCLLLLKYYCDLWSQMLMTYCSTMLGYLCSVWFLDLPLQVALMENSGLSTNTFVNHHSLCFLYLGTDLVYNMFSVKWTRLYICLHNHLCEWLYWWIGGENIRIVHDDADDTPVYNSIIALAMWSNSLGSYARTY